MDSNKLILDMIRCDDVSVELAPFCEKQCFDFLSYYEMPLYFRANDVSISETVEKAKAQNAAIIQNYTALIRTITSELDRRGIEHCILVGIPFVNAWHDRPTLRLQEDIDFFVREEELDKVRDLMSGLGFFEHSPTELRKHIAFINQGFGPKDLSTDGRCAVKFYRRMTDRNFCGAGLSAVLPYITVRDGYRVLCPEMALVHLIIHAHYYDFHPKILADIYMLCKNGALDWDTVLKCAGQFGAQRLLGVVLSIMRKAGLTNLPEFGTSGEAAFLSDLFLSWFFWGKSFVRLTPDELTRFRCYLFDAENYSEYYAKIERDGQLRRVSPMRDAFLLESVNDQIN